MSLLEEIQTAAVDSKTDLGALLRRCKILASRLGSKQLEDWLIWESNGYPSEVDVPDYRKWGLILKGHFSGPMQSGVRNAPIPSICVPEDVRDNVSQYVCRNSVSGLEQMLLEAEKGSLNVTLGDLNVLLGMKVYRGMNCIHAWGEFSSGCVVEALNSVRNRILDFALAVEKEYPNAGERTPKSAVDAGRVSQIFQMTVHGGAVNVMGTAQDSVVTLQAVAGSLVGVRNSLLQLGAPEEEIADLEQALRDEPSASSTQQLGPRVAAWLGMAIQSVASGAWKVGIDVAGKVLTKVICNYYGIPG